MATLFGSTRHPLSPSEPSDNFETSEHVPESVFYGDPLKGKSHFQRQQHMRTAIKNPCTSQRNVEKVTSIKFHCRKSEETKSSKMKFKSVLIVLLAVFVISTLIVETECQGPGRRRGGGGGGRGGDHLIDKVCN